MCIAQFYSTEIDNDDIVDNDNPKYDAGVYDDDERNDTRYENVVFCFFYQHISSHRTSLHNE